MPTNISLKASNFVTLKLTRDSVHRTGKERRLDGDTLRDAALQLYNTCREVNVAWEDKEVIVGQSAGELRVEELLDGKTVRGGFDFEKATEALVPLLRSFIGMMRRQGEGWDVLIPRVGRVALGRNDTVGLGVGDHSLWWDIRG